MPDPGRVAVGSLRWPVVIAQRTQSPTPSGGILDGLTDVLPVYADIQPTGALTFYSGVQVDTPITHRITIRWLDWIDTTFVILRRTTRPDGSVRQDTFRIRRQKEVDGRQRFLELECEQEMRE